VTDVFEVPKMGRRQTPAEWLEYSPILLVGIFALGFAYIGQIVAARGLQAALDLNRFNFIFLMMGLLLHWRPQSFVRAVNRVVPATAASESLPNLINPFFMLPIVGILKVRARDLVGYALLYFVVIVPVVLFLARNIAYIPPVL
jgi:short subunit fatty acids transporter